MVAVIEVLTQVGRRLIFGHYVVGQGWTGRIHTLLPVDGAALDRTEEVNLRMRRKVIGAVVMGLIISLASTRPALAYIDPNTGGMLFQALAAGFAVLSGVALVFSRQIRVLFARAMRTIRVKLKLDARPQQDGQADSEAAEEAQKH
jgi:hypothetical protein